jgi:transposase
MSDLSIARYFPFERVKAVYQGDFFDKTSSLIWLEPDLRYVPRCHLCRSPATCVHEQGFHRIVRDLNMAAHKTFLEVTYRKVRCPVCGAVRVEHLSFCDAGARITRRMARYIYELCKVMTVEEVARHLAVVLDYLTGRVVWMGENRGKAALDAFFNGMTAEQKAKIDAVAMDMWEPFINRVRHHCPQAKIVFDGFHVIKAFGQVIDKVRREEYRRASAEDKKVIQGSRYVLLKNIDHLSDHQRDHLQQLREMNATLNTLYILKDQLKTLFWYVDLDLAKKALENWCEMARTIPHPSVQTFIGRLQFFAYGILNHCDYAIDTGKLEGVNNKIKLIKRKAFGYHDPDYFALKVKQAFAGKSPPFSEKPRAGVPKRIDFLTLAFRASQPKKWVFAAPIHVANAGTDLPIADPSPISSAILLNHPFFHFLGGEPFFN